MRTHTCEAGRHTLQGSFAAREPVLTVDSGDEVVLSTLDVGWGLEAPRDGRSPRRKFEPRVEGPCLTGPVAVRQAKAGDTLAIHILEVEPGDYGFTYAGDTGFFNGELNRKLGIPEELTVLSWNLSEGRARCRDWSLPLAPFLGMMGLAHTRPRNAWHPGETGGNMDCAELTAGSVLYLPVEVDGGLLFVGDGHARQGDGEVSGTAIECPMRRVRLRLELANMKVAGPTIGTGYGWVTLGFSEDLDEALVFALQAMLDLMQSELSVSTVEALALASLVVDLRLTQIVNGVRGVHASWKRDLLRKEAT